MATKTHVANKDACRELPVRPALHPTPSNLRPLGTGMTLENARAEGFKVPSDEQIEGIMEKAQLERHTPSRTPPPSTRPSTRPSTTRHLHNHHQT